MAEQALALHRAASNEGHSELQAARMGNSSSVEDYTTRGQLLPGPVHQTVTHSRDFKSLADNKTMQTVKALLFPEFGRRGLLEN